MLFFVEVLLTNERVKRMKNYIKPTMNYIDLRVEEKLATSTGSYTKCVLKDGACKELQNGEWVLVTWYEGNLG